MDYSKKTIRKLIEDRRASLDEGDRRIRDENIFSRLIDHNLFKDAKSIFIYVSFDGEIDTHSIINYALKEGKIVCVPKIFTKAEGMHLMKIDSFSSLTPGYYGILEPPADSEEMSPEDIDLIIMPGVAFDENGGRVGYGGGFYDRLLAGSNIQSTKIALAYRFQVFDKVPSDKWDERVDMIITEEGIINCKQR